MKLKSILAMMFAALTLTVCTSCGSDDDDVTTADADNVAGTYVGDYSLSVMGSTSSDSDVKFVVTKVDDSHVTLTTPGADGGTGMTLPSLTAEKIPVTKTTVAGVDVYTASVDSYAGKTTVNNVEKAYTFSNVNIAVTGKAAVITYSLQYGNMPMAMSVQFAGTK